MSVETIDRPTFAEDPLFGQLMPMDGAVSINNQADSVNYGTPLFSQPMPVGDRIVSGPKLMAEIGHDGEAVGLARRQLWGAAAWYGFRAPQTTDILMHVAPVLPDHDYEKFLTFSAEDHTSQLIDYGRRTVLNLSTERLANESKRLALGHEITGKSYDDVHFHHEPLNALRRKIAELQSDSVESAQDSLPGSGAPDVQQEVIRRLTAARADRDENLAIDRALERLRGPSPSASTIHRPPEQPAYALPVAKPQGNTDDAPGKPQANEYSYFLVHTERIPSMRRAMRRGIRNRIAKIRGTFHMRTEQEMLPAYYEKRD